MRTGVNSLIASVFSILSAGAVTGRADTNFWINPSGGLFSAPSNWSLNTVPGSADIVSFTNTGPYVLTLDVVAANSSALFHQGSVTLAIPVGVWLLTNEWRIGETVSNTAQVTLTNGLLAVTNSAGTGLISVGRNGTGTLVMRGGNVVTDLLLATNGSRSILTFAHGELTTLHGVTVSNASKVTLGTTASNVFVWSALGGTNRIITDRFTYGGLTLGASSGGSHARINLSGSNTILSVPGLDTYGRNEIYISGGAKFQTYSVQLGLQTAGTNNIVVISGEGSSWINDYLMYFGIHTGGQTMIITNGGYFKTGGPTFADQDFTTFEYLGSRIIVTGSNSWFNSDGETRFGRSWSVPRLPLNNLLLVENGGRFWSRELTYGSTNLFMGVISRPGNAIEIADGSLWIGSLTFSVGTLQINSGTGTIDQLNINGGTNAILQLQGNLLVGHHGSLNPGDLRIGNSNATIASLNGELHMAGCLIGAFPGDSGSMTMNGGSAYVANSVQVSPMQGASGRLTLNSLGTTLYATALTIGTNGLVVVTNSALLQINNCTVSGILDVRTGSVFAGGPIANGASSGTLCVGSNGWVMGDGTITGGLLVDSGGKVEVIRGDGTLAIQGDYQQNAGGTLKMQVGGTAAGSQYGVLNVSGGVTLAGKLSLEFVNGFAPQAGDAFQILQFGTTAVGGFEQVEIIGVPPSFQYVLQTNATHAYVLTALNGATPPPPPELSIAKSGSQLVVSWPASATNFTLQSGSSLEVTGWLDLGTVSNAYQFVPTNNIQFFRLIQPP